MDKEFDFSTAKLPTQVPALQQLRQAYANQNKLDNDQKPIHAIEPDVWQLIQKHADNSEELARLNGMIRLLFA